MISDIRGFKKESKKIETLIYKSCIDPTGKSKAIADGVIDIEVYCKQDMRILWILREPVDEADATGGGWSIAEALKIKLDKRISLGRSPTYQSIVYVGYGIYHQIKSFDDMDYISAKPEMVQVLRKMAIINVKKLPGFTHTDDSVLEDAYLKNRDILIRQLKSYKPNIVVGGGTLRLFYNDLNLSKARMEKLKTLKVYIDKKLIYINAYHPANRGSREAYVDEIIGAVNQFWNG